MPEKEHFHECSVKGKLTELLKVTISVFSKPVTNHPRKLCLLSTQAVSSPPKKDVAPDPEADVRVLECDVRVPGWVCLNRALCAFITWTQLINALVQLGDLQLSLAIKNEWCSPPWSTTLPPELSSPWFQSTLAVTQWFWGAALLPLALAVLSSLGHSGDVSAAWLSCGLPWCGLTPVGFPGVD